MALPYRWVFGHDVRPASRSLGINGCEDCHSGDANFYYSAVDIDSPVPVLNTNKLENIDFMDLSRAGTWVFSMSFLFRPWLKIFIIACTFILFMVLLTYIVKVLRYITENIGK